MKISFLLFIILLTSTSLKAQNWWTRANDPIIVQGEKIATLIGTKITHLCAYSFINSKFTAIPFQVDERDEDGSYVYQFGKEASNDSDLGKIDANDELVLMGWDLGEHASKALFPKDFIKGIELEVTDPITKSKKWAYIFSFNNIPEKSSVDYIKFNPLRQKIEARNYTLRLDKSAPLVYDYFAITESAGGNGLNILDRNKVRADTKLFLGGLQVSRNEEDFKSRLVAYNDGPVRVIRLLRDSVNIFAGIQSPSATERNLYYPNFIQYPVSISIPFNPKILFKEINILILFDFNKNSKGMKLYSKNNFNGVLIDGKMDQEEEELKFDNDDWLVLTGSQGSWLLRYLIKDKFPDVNISMYYKDDEKIPQPPEHESGQIGTVGLKLSNLTEVNKAEVSFMNYIFIPVNYKYGDEKIYFNITDNPVIVNVREIR